MKDEKIGRMVTRVVLPRVVMHSRYHYGVSHFYLIVVVSFWFLKQDKEICNALSNCCVQAFSENFTGLELEDGGGRGTSGYFSVYILCFEPILLVMLIFFHQLSLYVIYY